MRVSQWVIGLAAVAAVSWMAQDARAAFGEFQYGSTVIPSPINPTSTVGGPGSQLSQAGVGNFTTPTAPTFNAALLPQGADIEVGTLTVTDLAIGDAYSDTYGPTPITITLKLKDVSSGDTGVFSIMGSLTGTVASNGTTAASFFNNPFTASSSTQEIGTTFYTVSVVPSKAFSAPGSPPTAGTGTNGMYVVDVHASRVPEPGALALLAGLALAGIRRRSTIP